MKDASKCPYYSEEQVEQMVKEQIMNESLDDLKTIIRNGVRSYIHSRINEYVSQSKHQSFGKGVIEAKGGGITHGISPSFISDLVGEVLDKLGLSDFKFRG